MIYLICSVSRFPFFFWNILIHTCSPSVCNGGSQSEPRVRAVKKGLISSLSGVIVTVEEEVKKKNISQGETGTVRLTHPEVTVGADLSLCLAQGLGNQPNVHVLVVVGGNQTTLRKPGTLKGSGEMGNWDLLAVGHCVTVLFLRSRYFLTHFCCFHPFSSSFLFVVDIFYVSQSRNGSSVMWNVRCVRTYSDSPTITTYTSVSVSINHHVLITTS